jgi:hypothetical protein
LRDDAEDDLHLPGADHALAMMIVLKAFLSLGLFDGVEGFAVMIGLETSLNPLGTEGAEGGLGDPAAMKHPSMKGLFAFKASLDTGCVEGAFGSPSAEDDHQEVSPFSHPVSTRKWIQPLLVPLSPQSQQLVPRPAGC